MKRKYLTILLTAVFVLGGFASLAADKKGAAPEPKIKREKAGGREQGKGRKKFKRKKGGDAVNPKNEWDFIEVGLLPGIPPQNEISNVYGVKAGILVSGGRGRVGGVEASAIASTTENVAGIQCAPVCCVSKNIEGLQTSVVNVSEKVDGLQFGIVNCSKESGFQLGIVNWIEDSSVPFMPIINFRF